MASQQPVNSDILTSVTASMLVLMGAKSGKPLSMDPSPPKGGGVTPAGEISAQ